MLPPKSRAWLTNDQIREGLQALAKNVHDNEPNCSRYQIYEQTNAEGGNVPQFVVVEEYADKAAFDHHLSTQAFKDLGARVEKEDLLAKPLDIKFVGMNLRNGSCIMPH